MRSIQTKRPLYCLTSSPKVSLASLNYRLIGYRPKLAGTIFKTQFWVEWPRLFQCLDSSGDVRCEVQRLIRILGEGGRYILATSHFLMNDVPVENVVALYDEARFSGFDRRRQAYHDGDVL